MLAWSQLNTPKKLTLPMECIGNLRQSNLVSKSTKVNVNPCSDIVMTSNANSRWNQPFLYLDNTYLSF